MASEASGRGSHLLRRSKVPARRLEGAVAELVGARVVGLGPLSARGRFNDAVAMCTADGRWWAVRVAPNPAWFPVLRVERGMLGREAALAAILGEDGPVPAVRFFDDGGLLGGSQMMVRELLPGRNGQDLLDRCPDAASEIWRAMTRFDQSLPSLADHQVGFPGAWMLRWSEVLQALGESFLADLVDHRIDTPSCNRFVSRMSRASGALDARPLRLCHGDLWPKNALFESLAGDEACPSHLGDMKVLDWERAFVGDPMTQWIRLDGAGGTVLSIDSDPLRPTSAAKDCPEALQVVYAGVVGLQMLAESLRNPVDICLAARLVADAAEIVEGSDDW